MYLIKITNTKLMFKSLYYDQLYLKMKDVKGTIT